MSDGTIDNLNIQIEADAEKASQSLNELSNSLIKLKKTIKYRYGKSFKYIEKRKRIKQIFERCR